MVHRIKPDILQVRIVWKGGETTTANIPITVGSLAMLSSLEDFEKAIIKLSKVGKTDLEIAQLLTEQGYRSPMKKHVVDSTVRNIRLKNGIFRNKSQSHPLKVSGYLSVTQLARMIRVPLHWIYDRIHNGQIQVDQSNDSVKGKYLFADTPETIKMLKDLKQGKK